MSQKVDIDLGVCLGYPGHIGWRKLEFLYSTFCVKKDAKKFYAESVHRRIPIQMSQNVAFALDNGH